jgi:hypothetical protein
MEEIRRRETEDEATRGEERSRRLDGNLSGFCLPRGDSRLTTTVGQKFIHGRLQSGPSDRLAVGRLSQATVTVCTQEKKNIIIIIVVGDMRDKALEPRPGSLTESVEQPCRVRR